MTRRFASGVLTLLLLSATGAISPLKAQWARLTNPHFNVHLTHPPAIALKGVQKVAVMDFAGDCGDEFSQRLLQAVARTEKFDVIDRSNLEAILQEQGFQMTSAVTGQAAVKVGQLLGPAAMFAGKATSCNVEESPLLTDLNSVTGAVKAYIRKITATMNVSVSLVDFTTGRQHAGRFIEARGQLQSESRLGPPEPPSRQEVMNRMYLDAVRQAMRLILPWDETVEIVVYDDDDAQRFQLKPAVEQMKRGDLHGAAEGLQAAVDQGGGPKTTDKDRAKAYYDLGIALMYSDQLNSALPLLDKAAGIDPKNRIIADGLTAAKRMHALEEDQKRLEANAVTFGAASSGSPTSKGVSTSVGADLMTNADIVDLVRARMPDAVILAKIKASKTKFDSSPKALIALKQVGASDAVILAVTQAAPAN
ncbi:MAG TPA: CsgG/HfaB family protein [Vicinamibacterales bacterium]|jgi:tetratricopeptide (TPR) repeat protein|nr:CsgG/HfaB family protein [Vicinamibacterales bacterium]